MSKVTLRALKQHLRQRSRDELIGDIADLFTRLDAVKDYYALRLYGPSEDLIAAYKARIKHEFFPARGFGAARLSVARRAVTDYKRVSPPPASLADLMLFYVEQGVAYTNTYGDINEPFYRSMESMYQQAVQLIATSDLRDEFEERCRQIVADTWNIGWGFHDRLSDIMMSISCQHAQAPNHDDASGRSTNVQEEDRMSVVGTWRVVASPDFDDDVLHAEGTPSVTLRQEGDRLVGAYQIGLQSGDLDGRLQGDGSAVLTFEGMDEMDPVDGAATARLDGDRLIFTLMYHQGDDYTFECERRP